MAITALSKICLMCTSWVLQGEGGQGGGVRIAHAGHLGGAAMGALAFAAYRRGMFRRW